jgi:LPXTG-site transpeptidase (sortase) family protein
MYSFRRQTEVKAGSHPLFFLFTFLGSAIFLLLVPGVVQGFQGGSFLPPVKIVHQKVAVAAAKAVPKKLEARLKIPKIKVNAAIKDMGVTSEGVMAIPGNRTDVGWYSSGTRPGDTGSAVIGGHNRWGNGVAVFNHLDQLKKGDVLSVMSAKGISTSFVVREVRTYDATDFDNEIFLSVSGAHLNLITCSGVWDPSIKNYTKRLVIFTDAEQVAGL